MLRAMRNLKLTGYIAGLLLAALYIFNPGAGIIELLPDQLPIVGNLDEAAMTALFLACLRGLRQLRRDRKEGRRGDGALPRSLDGERPLSVGE
jgi:hypothetical protein